MPEPSRVQCKHQNQDSGAEGDGESQNIVESAEHLCRSYQLQGEGTCEKLQTEQRVLLDNPVRGDLNRSLLDRPMDCCQLKAAIHGVPQGVHCLKEGTSQSTSPLAEADNVEIKQYQETELLPYSGKQGTLMTVPLLMMMLLHATTS